MGFIVKDGLCRCCGDRLKDIVESYSLYLEVRHPEHHNDFNDYWKPIEQVLSQRQWSSRG